MAKYVTPMFGMNNRSMLTVPVVPNGTAGIKALRATQTKCVQAASIPTSVGAKRYPNGKKVTKVT
jgi:hypothetical protein